MFYTKIHSEYISNSEINPQIDEIHSSIKNQFSNQPRSSLTKIKKILN